MDHTRRQLLQFTLGGIAAATWLRAPPARAANAPGWNPALFKATSLEDLARILGLKPQAGDTVKMDAPDIAEIGAAVPVSVLATAPGVTMLGIAVPKNPVALVGLFHLEAGALPHVATRIKMAQSADVYALAQVGDTLLYGRKMVKVTIGGCGGA